jgi:DNA-binding beta-propeller fold protein YncE
VLVVHTGAVDSNGVSLGAGSMSVLDARSGVVLRTVVVGVAPIAVAVDERSGRAVVVNAGGPVRIPDAWGQVLDRLRRWLPFVPPRATETRTVPGSVSIVDASG